MIPQPEAQLNGLIDPLNPTKLDEVDFTAGWSSLPTGVFWRDSISGTGNDLAYSFSSGFLDITSPTGSPSQFSYLRFDTWADFDALAWDQVLFTIDEIAIPDNPSNSIRLFFAMQNVPTASRGGYLRTGTDGVGRFNYWTTAQQLTNLTFNPADAQSNIIHTIGWGYQINLTTGQRTALAVYGGAKDSERICSRKVTSGASILTLGSNELKCYLAVQSVDGSEFTLRIRGARLRKWRFK